MELSKRLLAVAGLLSDHLKVADVGTDHAYIPIYLLEQQKSPAAIAMDIHQGPLLRAQAHIKEHGLENQIEVRQSDGVNRLAVGECDAVIIAGMGGALIIQILEEGHRVFAQLQEFILQPQSEIENVRKYLCEHNFCIVAEDMVLEDGKFYPMMRVICGKTEVYQTEEFRYGKYLLQQKHPVLKMFLEKEIYKREKILLQLQKEKGDHIQLRIQEIEEEKVCAEKTLQHYFER